METATFCPVRGFSLHPLNLCPCGTPSRVSMLNHSSLGMSQASVRGAFLSKSKIRGSPLTSTNSHRNFGQSVREGRFGQPRKGRFLQGREALRGRKGVITCSQPIDVINSLGLDTLTFLAATVLIIPTFKSIKVSPVIGFLGAGVVLNTLGWFRNVEDIERLAELGILFLLFEMGLELSIERLRALAKFAFGMGLAQVILCSLTFTFFELPINNALGTRILTTVLHSKPDLVNIRSLDEAVVIGAALSLSSSAFVLQLLAEKGELPTRFGSATLGVLLMQDIAVVPLLVILPILESGKLSGDPSVLWATLGITTLKALGGLGALLLGGRLLLRRVFEMVADSRSTEAFIALSLLTATGTSYLTQKLGFSDSLGAFLAGALLSETNYRTQIEADIKPFRGLLIGLFFVTTGTSIDLNLIMTNWPDITALLLGMLAVKTGIVTGLAPRFGLTLAESVRTGLLLSQGGEFAFVVLALANRLGVLPSNLNRLLIIVVVLSMALTPLLNEFGRVLAAKIDDFTEVKDVDADAQLHIAEAVEPIVIIGFGQLGQVLANLLSTPLSSAENSQSKGWPYVAFDLDPKRVKAARALGFPVIFGDGSRPQILASAGISKPKAIMVMYTGRQRAVQAVRSLSEIYKDVPIYARAQDLTHFLELKFAGATEVVPENTETSLRLGSKLLEDMGMRKDDVTFVRKSLRESMELQANEWGAKGGEINESQLVIVAPPKLERGPRANAPTGEVAPSAVGATTLLQTAGAVTAGSNQLLEKGLGGVKPNGEIPLAGGVALASWKDSQEEVLLSQEIALRKQLEDLRLEQVKLRYGSGTEQGPYCLVPSKGVEEESADATADVTEVAADISEAAASADGAGDKGSEAQEVPISEESGNGVASPQGSDNQEETTVMGEAEGTPENGASAPDLTKRLAGSLDAAVLTYVDSPESLRREEASSATPSEEYEPSISGSTDDDVWWAWASPKQGVEKMQERGPLKDDDLGSAKEEDSVWSWASSKFSKAAPEVVAESSSIDDDLGSSTGSDEDSFWSWATSNRSEDGGEQAVIDSEGFLRAAVSWNVPTRGSAGDIVQKVPLELLRRWAGQRKAAKNTAEGDKSSGDSKDQTPVGESEEEYETFVDDEEFSGYMTVEEYPNYQGDDLEGQLEWVSQSGKEPRESAQPPNKSAGILLEEDSRGMAASERRKVLPGRNVDVEQVQAEMRDEGLEIENDKQRLQDVAPEFVGTEYETGSDLEAHSLQDDEPVVEDADRSSVEPVTASKP